MTGEKENGIGHQPAAAEPSKLPLEGLRVLLLSSGHVLGDHRIYGKIARSIAAMGADVKLVALADGGETGDVHAIGLSGPGTRGSRIFLQPWRCLMAARRFPADVVHFHDPEMLVTLPVAKLIWPKAKFVYDVHEDIANLIQIRDWIPRGLRRPLSLGVGFCEKTLAHLADAILGVTPPLTAKFRNRLKATAYNFVTRDYFEAALRNARPLQEREYDVIHVGTLSRPRAEFLGEVFQLVHRQNSAARSLVLGCSAEIESFIRPLLPMGSHVIGRVPHREIPAYVGNAKVGLDIHPWPQPHLDVALPMKVCEYLASECGVVASLMPVLRELVAQSGVDLDGFRFIEGATPELFARELVRMLQRIKDQPLLGSHNRAFALQYMNWNTQAQNILDLYLRLNSQCGI